MFLEILMREAVLAPVLLVVGLILYECLRTKPPFEVRPKLPNLPVVGAREGEWFPTLRAMWRNSIDVRTATQEAYQFKDQLCLLPIVDLGRAVIVPPTEIAWYLDQPDSDINTHDHIIDAFQLNWTLTDPRLVQDNRPVHHLLISTKLTREINNLLPVLAGDIPSSLSDSWGTDTENFKELCPMDDLPHVVGRVVNLAFVGAPTCYNRAMVDSAIKFARGLALTAIVLRFTVQTLRPLLAPLVTLPQRIATWGFFNALRPEVNRRLQDLPGSASKYNDFLQWTISAAVQSGDPYMMEPDTIMGRVLLLNFLSIHTTTLALTHVLLDLAASCPAYIEELRTEIATALEAHGGEWNRRTLGDMPKLDSVFRESQRMHPPAMIGSPKLVTAPNGVTTPSGVHLRYGTYLAILGYPVLHDPALYPEPETFKPFRFAELREAADQEGLKLERARQGWAATSKSYSTFGAGRHACPGRFFASTSIKVFLAYILLNYDIEKQPERPITPSIGMALLPPLKARIRFKRRKEPLYNLDQARLGSLE
jgi:cytochrome P450